MFIGARVLKTGIAVTLALLLCRWLNVEPPIFAAITAVINMQPSVNKALKNAWEQVSVHIIGVVLAILLGMLLGNSPWIIGLGVILMISLCNKLGLSQAITLGVASMVFVLDAPPEQFLKHATARSIAIFLGLAVALVVNRILAPPKYKERLLGKLKSLFNDSSAYFLHSIETFVYASEMVNFEVNKPVELEERLEEVMQIYEHAREEFTSQDNAQLIERLLEISRGFLERGKTINEMTAQRVKRRQAPDSPIPAEGVSPEFQRILDILMLGKSNLESLVQKVSQGLAESHEPEPIMDNHEYWIEFDNAMDQWQRKVSGVFYLRAMMEIAVVATEMRWAARRLKALYNISSKGNPIF